MADAMLLSEGEALEILAFLVTAARTQVDEAAEYGSLRLLTAATRLAETMVERVSPETRAFPGSRCHSSFPTCRAQPYGELRLKAK